MSDKAKGLFDPWTMETLRKEGINPYTTSPSSVQRPYTMLGIPNASVRSVPELERSNANGFVLSSNRLTEEKQNMGATPVVFARPDVSSNTIGHETEHLLARQNTGFTQMPREYFNKILAKQAPFSNFTKSKEFLDGLIESLPYLEEKYGISNGYMTPNFIKKQGEVGLYEIFATLAGAESTQNVDLTKDPELRKTMFKDPVVRQAYNAVTGLRQTRMDPRDIPPYTYVPEPSWWENVFKNPFR